MTGQCPTPWKRIYRSRAAARRYQRRRQVPVGVVKDRLYPYQCPGCHLWHLTHQTPAQQAAISARIQRKANTRMTTSRFDDVHDARELIGQAIGAGSRCWVGGTGDLEFDSTRATEVVDAAYNRLQVILAGILSAPLAQRATGATSVSLLDRLAETVGRHESWQRPDRTWECACGSTCGTKINLDRHVAQAALGALGLIEEWSDDIGGAAWGRHLRLVTPSEFHPGPRYLASDSCAKPELPQADGPRCIGCGGDCAGTGECCR